MKIFVLLTEYADYSSSGWDDGAPGMKIILVSHDDAAIKRRRVEICPADFGGELQGDSTAQTWENGEVVHESEKFHSFMATPIKY